MLEDVRRRLVRVSRATVGARASVLDRPLQELGADSFSLILLLAGIHDEFHLLLSSRDLSVSHSLDEIATTLAARLSDVRTESAGTSALPAPDEEQAARVPALANRYSYFVRRVRNLSAWNVVSHVYRLLPPVDVDAFARAVDLVVARHDSLRLRVCVGPGGVEQVCLPPREVQPLRVLEIPGALSASMASRWMEEQSRAAQQALALPGDLFRVLLFRDVFTGSAWFCVIAHHLLVDSMSFRMVMASLVEAYACWAKGAGEDPPPAPPTLSFARYSSESIAYWARRGPEEVPRWLSLPWHLVSPLLPGTSPADPLNTEEHSVQVLLALEDLPVLRDGGGAGDLQITDLIVAGIARAFRRWSGHAALHLSLVMHGRTEDGLSGELARTVGWISETVPIVLPLEADRRALALEARAQLERAASSGRSFGVLRHLVPSTVPGVDAIRRLPDADVSLNIDLREPLLPRHSAFFVREESVVAPSVVAPSTQRVFLLSGGVIRRQGKVCVAWDFSERLLSRSHVEAFTELCREEITDLARSVEGQ
jgi:hypothetical protein